MHVESYELWLDSDGQFFSWDHTVKEDAPGAMLPVGKAKALAVMWLNKRGVDLSRYKFIDSSTEKREKRVDHYFTWEKKKPRIDEAAFRLSVTVQGDEVVSRSQYIKVPDAYLREQSKQTTRQSIFMGIGSLLTLCIFIGIFIVFVKQFVHRSINWRFALICSAVFSIFIIIKQIDGIPTFYSGYDTDEPLSRYVISSLIYSVLEIVGKFIGMTLLFGFADALYRQAFPKKPSISQWFGMAEGNDWRFKAMREGVIVALTSLPVAALIAALSNIIDNRFFRGLASAGSSTSTCSLDGLSPILGALPEVSVMLVVPVVLALIVSLCKLYLKKIWIIITVIVGVSLIFICASVSSWLGFAQAILSLVMIILVLWFMLGRWYGQNAYSYAALILLTAASSPAIDLMMQADIALRINGVILAVLCLVPIGVSLYPRKKVVPIITDVDIESGA
jgi:hypothetical protein